jgi:hypothetical protein
MIETQHRYRLGELLLDSGLISERQLRRALGDQRRDGERLGDTLIRLGLVERRQLSAALAEQYVRRFFGALGIAALALNPASAMAGSVRTQMSVSVTVLNSATSTVRPLIAGASGSSAAVSLACTAGGPARIGIEHGKLAAAGTNGAPGYVVTWRSGTTATLSCGNPGQSVTAPLELAADRTAAASGGVQAVNVVIAY